MQKITLIGRLGRDAAIRTTQNGDRFLSFTLAVNSKIKGEEKTTWYDVTSRNARHIDNLAPYLTKGSGIVVVGELNAALQERDGQHFMRLSVNADSIDFMGAGNSGSTQNTAENVATPSAASVAEEVPADETPKVTRKAAPKPAPAPEPESAPEDDLPF